MKTFYAVTDGDYSDYHIIAITDNYVAFIMCE